MEGGGRVTCIVVIHKKHIGNTSRIGSETIRKTSLPTPGLHRSGKQHLLLLSKFNILKLNEFITWVMESQILFYLCIMDFYYDAKAKLYILLVI